MAFAVVANGLFVPVVGNRTTLRVGHAGAHIVIARRLQPDEAAAAALDWSGVPHNGGYFVVVAESAVDPRDMVVLYNGAAAPHSPTAAADSSGSVVTVLVEEAALVTVAFVQTKRSMDEVLCQALRIAVRHLTSENGGNDTVTDDAAPQLTAQETTTPLPQPPARIGAVPMDVLQHAVRRGIGERRFAARFGGGSQSADDQRSSSSSSSSGGGSSCSSSERSQKSWMAWLECCPEISAFTAKDESAACVAKRGPPITTDGATTQTLGAVGAASNSNRAQPLQLPSGWKDEANALLRNVVGGMLPLDAVVALGCAETFGWRQSAASFSTMMRYFQRARAHFCWSTNSDHKTILRVAPQKHGDDCLPDDARVPLQHRIRDVQSSDAGSPAALVVTNWG